MKDLDFDELDKAVNSLMGGVKEKDSGDTSHTLDISTTLAPDEKPAYSNLTQVAGQIGSEAIDRQEKTVSLESTEQAPVTAKPVVPTQQKAGRFMDVVHPSSDMKRGALAKVSREGVTITPAAVSPEEPAQPSDEVSPASASGASLQPSDTTGNLPLSAAPELTLDDDTSSVDPTPSTPEPAEPLSSPFLPDAKVEKRPLGSEPPTGAPMAAPEMQAAEPPVAIDSGVNAKKDESSVMDNITDPVKTDDDLTMHVPEEFQNELLAVEKNTDAVVPGEKETLITPAPESMLGVASIPKQYQEKPSTNDAKSGAIYDTDHYHKPLAHPPKKSSGWLWVIAIVVIIALGAGAGAFVYFVGL